MCQNAWAQRKCHEDDDEAHLPSITTRKHPGHSCTQRCGRTSDPTPWPGYVGVSDRRRMEAGEHELRARPPGALCDATLDDSRAIRSVRELLGHKAVCTTMIKPHISNEADEAFAARGRLICVELRSSSSATMSTQFTFAAMDSRPPRSLFAILSTLSRTKSAKKHLNEVARGHKFYPQAEILRSPRCHSSG